MGRTFPVAAVAHFRVILILFPLMHSYCYSSLNDAYSVFFLNTLPLQRSSLIQINHCCIREMCKAVTDTAGQTNGSKPESLRSIGPSIFSIFFFLLYYFLPAQKKNHTKCILNSEEYRKGRRHLSQQLECWKGTI